MRPLRVALAALVAGMFCLLLARPGLADSPFLFDEDTDWDDDTDAGVVGREPSASGNPSTVNEIAKHTRKELLWGSYRPQNYFGFRPRLPESFFMGLAWSDASSYQGLGQLRHATNDQQQVRYAWTRHNGRSFGEERIIDPATNVGFNVSFVKQLPESDDRLGGGSWAVRVKGKALDPSRPAQVSFFSYYASESPDTTLSFGAEEATGPRRGLPWDKVVRLAGSSPELGEFGIRVVHPSVEDLSENGVTLNRPVAGAADDPEAIELEETAYFAAPMPQSETWRAANVIQNGVAMSMQAAIEKSVPSLAQMPREEQARAMLEWDTHGLPHPGVAGRLPNLVAPGEATLTALQDTYELNPFQARGSEQSDSDADERHIFAFDIFFDAPSTPGQKLSSAKLTRMLDEARTTFDDSYSKSLPLVHLSDSKEDKAKDESFARELISSVLGGVGYFHGTAVVDRSLSIAESDTGDEFGSEGNGQPIDLDAVDNLRASRMAEAAEEDDDESPVRREGPFSLTSGTPGRSFFPRGFYWDEGFHLPAISALDPELGLEILHDWFSSADEDGWIPREMALGTESESRVPSEFLRQDPAHGNPPTPILALRLVIDRLGLGLDSPDSAQDNDNITSIHQGDGGAWEWGASSQLAFGSNPNVSSNFVHKQLRQAALERLAEFYPTLKKHYGWFCRSQQGLASAGGRSSSSEFPTSNTGAPGQCASAFRWRGRSRSGHVFASGLDDYPRAQVPHTGELHVDLHSWMAAFARNMAYVANVLAHHNIPVRGEAPLQDAAGFTTDFNRLQRNLESRFYAKNCFSFWRFMLTTFSAVRTPLVCARQVIL